MRWRKRSTVAWASCSPRRLRGSAVSRARKAALAACSVALTSLAFLACGSGERTFTVDEFVDAINDQGAGVSLGAVIAKNPDGVDVYSITLTEATADVGAPAQQSPDALHGSGTLLLVDSADDAHDEFSRCEEAPALTCFRAANAVLRFEDMDGADQARISTSLEALQTAPD